MTLSSLLLPGSSAYKTDNGGWEAKLGSRNYCSQGGWERLYWQGVHRERFAFRQAEAPTAAMIDSLNAFDLEGSMSANKITIYRQ